MRKNTVQFFLLDTLLAFTFCLPSSQQAFAFSNCAALPTNMFSQPLSLPEITDLALACNPSTIAAWAQFKASYANIGIAKSAYWPQITAAMQWNEQSHGNNSNNSSTSDNPSNYGPSISLNYLVWDFGTRAEKVHAAKLQWQAANLTQNATLQQLIFQVEQAYYQALGQQALVLANQTSVTEGKANLTVAKALHQHGLATIGDIYQAQSALAQIELQTAEAKGAQQIALGQLLTSMGLPINSPIRLADLPEQIHPQAILKSFAELLEYAKQHRPDLLSARLQTKAAAAQLAITQQQALPTLQLSATSAINYPLKNGGNRNNLGIAITLPLFTGFAQHYAQQQAQVQTLQAQAQTEALSQQVALQVWQAYFNLQTCTEAINYSIALLKSSLQASQQAFGQYRAGVGNILNV